jgi:Cu-processing system permease protein
VKTIWIIARLTCLETSRRRIMWVALGLSLGFLVFFALSFNAMRHNFLAGSKYLPVTAALNWSKEAKNILTMVGLYSVNMLALLLTGFASADSVSGEVASGAIHTVLAKPLGRWQVVAGKWLGFASLITIYLLLMSGGILGSVYLLSGYAPPNILRGLALMWLDCLLFLSLSLAVGSRVSTSANGTFLFGLFAFALLGSWMEQIGSTLSDTASSQMGTFVSLLLPCDAIWRRAAYEMRPSLSSPMSFSPMMPMWSYPSAAMIWYAIGYTLIALAAAVYGFSHRDV